MEVDGESSHPITEPEKVSRPRVKPSIKINTVFRPKTIHSKTFRGIEKGKFSLQITMLISARIV